MPPSARPPRRRRLGHDQVEHAADRVAAVEHRGRAAHHLDARRRRMSTSPVISPKSVWRRGVVQAQAVLEEEHAQAALAADDRPRLVRADAVDVDARLLAQQVGGVAGEALDLLGRITVTGVATSNMSRSEPVAVTVVVAKNEIPKDLQSSAEASVDPPSPCLPFSASSPPARRRTPRTRASTNRATSRQ